MRLLPLAAVALPGTADAARQPGGGAALHDARLAALAGEPGITRLRDLGTGHPRWGPDARAAFAALLTSGLDIPARYAPPPGTSPARLRAALDAAVTASPVAASGWGAATETEPPWRPPVTDLRAASAAVDERMITLLAILGPDACAADPLLPLRLAGNARQLRRPAPVFFRKTPTRIPRVGAI